MNMNELIKHKTSGQIMIGPNWNIEVFPFSFSFPLNNIEEFIEHKNVIEKIKNTIEHLGFKTKALNEKHTTTL